MLVKIVDVALAVTFLTVHNLVKLRNRLTLRTQADHQEHDRLVAEWTAACHKRDALQAELSEPTTSRLYDTQATLVRTAQAAGDDCHYLLVKLRRTHS